jgi:hypothetical protein
MRKPAVDWSCMRKTLTALKLPTPAPQEVPGEEPACTLLRALPYVYTSGAFGTVRGALAQKKTVRDLVAETSGGRLTAFPAVGFLPRELPEGSRDVEYTMHRTIVGVVGHVVITIRLPDVICRSGQRHPQRPKEQSRLVIRTRFLFSGTMPKGRQLAEAIGIHQASTARAVAEDVRDRLGDNAREARRLDGPGHSRKRRRRLEARAPSAKKEKRPDLRAEANAAATHTDDLAEIAQQLDRRFSLILRRFGNDVDHAPKGAQKLIPPEVERRYRFALDEARSLQRDCRLTAQVVRQTLARDERAGSERFQLLVALITSAVLIPTLIASIFGASVKVPAADSGFSFIALLLVIVSVAAISFIVLLNAQKHGRRAPIRTFLFPGLAGIVILVAYAVFLARA